MAVKTIQEILDGKAGFDEKRNKVYTMQTESLGEIKYKKASRTELIQAQKMDEIEIDPYIVFTHIVEPNLSDKSLQDGCKMTGREPHKIVDELFDTNDVVNMSLAIIGKNKGDVVKDIKNS